MNYTGFQLDAFLTCAFQEEAGSGEFRVSGLVPPIKRKKRRFLVTVRGEKFYVPEDQIDEWISEKEEEIVSKAIRSPRIRRPDKPVHVPKMETDVGESYFRAMIDMANERIRAQITALSQTISKQTEEDEEDEEIALLMAL